MAKYQIFIESNNISAQQVHPLGKVVFQYKKENKEVFYKISLKNKLVFQGEDYTTLNDVLKDNTCEVVTIRIQRQCENNFTTFWTGTFTYTDCEVDKDKCIISVLPEYKSPQNDLKGKLEQKQNFWNLSFIPSVKGLNGKYEAHQYFQYHLTTPPSGNTFAIELSEAGKWCQEKRHVQPVNDWVSGTSQTALFFDVMNYFSRISVEHPCINYQPSPPYGGGVWTLLQNNCSASNKSTWFRCSKNVYSVTPSCRNGRKLSDLINYLFDGTGLTVVSNFFNINPDNQYPNNDAYTYALAYLQLLVLHQKSDIKRPNDSNAATYTAFEISIKDLLDDLRTIFNVYWNIEDGNIYIEHLSYFEKTDIGLDLSDVPQKLFFQSDKEKLFKEEKWEWMDSFATGYFGGPPIIYNCGEGSTSNKVKNFSTDLAFIYANNNPETVSDSGFLLLATYIDSNNNYVVINENIVLGFQLLIPALHFWGRPQQYGYIGYGSTTLISFNSWKKLRKQETFTTTLCCDTPFDPNEIIVGADGNAQLSSAVYDIAKDTLQVELIY